MDEKLEDAVQKLCSTLEMILPPDFLTEFAETPESELYIFHFGLGLYLRNNFFSADSELSRALEQHGASEKDAMSRFIVEKFHSYLQSKIRSPITKNR